MKENLFNRGKFDECWHDLGLYLKEIEEQQGLAKAIEALYDNQKELGFIQDDLSNLQRFKFPHPEDSNRYLCIQYNPNRLKRFGSASKPPPGVIEMHNNCVLCRKNIGWQQNGKELGYEIHVNDTNYTVLMNPFPLVPVHALAATNEHIGQAWSFNDEVSKKFSIEKIISDILELTSKLPGYLVFYNGINAGASIPSHFHLHIIKRESDDYRYPIELASKHKTVNAHLALDYPVHTWCWQGQKKDIMQGARNWVKDWLTNNNKLQNRLSANIIASLDSESGEINLYFIPRDQQRSGSLEFQGIIGGLEILGELVFITDQEKTRLNNGEITYNQVANILSSIHPHESIII